MSFKNEKIVEEKTCRKCSAIFHVTDKDLEFYKKVSPVFDWKKYQIPNPTLCYMCRNRRRLSYRNDRNLYKRKCDYSDKQIISIHKPGRDYKVYHHEIWWSDSWDPFNYGRDFNFNKSFFRQFSDLMKSVPRISAWIQNSENCDYTNFMKGWKNNYLSFASSQSEDVLYSTWTTRSYDSIDCFYCDNTKYSYESFQCHWSDNIFFSQYCNNSARLYYCYGCEWCQDCILSSNLVNKSYCIKNKQYSKEEYQILSKKYLDNLRKKELSNYLIVPDTVSSENSTGAEVYNSKNAQYCFGVNNIEDCKYCFEQFGWQKDCMDCAGSVWTLCYESWISVYSTNNIWVIGSTNCVNTYYSDLCIWLSDCFWCIWLKNQQYCIFNKQYSKQEYEILVPKIIEKMEEDWEWWEFFPSSLSPFGYNETVASEYFPLSKEEALYKWFNWSNYEAPFSKVEKIIPADKLPEDIIEIPDDILNWTIECKDTKKPFRITKQELDFYRRYNLPVPRIHPDKRHLDRMAMRNPRELFERSCDKCKKDIQSTYSPKRSETVYCEECYNQEIY